MPNKDIEKRRESRRNWYKNNKETEKNYIYKRRKEIREWFKNYKLSLKCVRCGESFPECLDFHHKGKKDNLVTVLVNRGCSIEKIKEEMSKCEILCANCHRKEHFKNKKH